MLKKVMLAESVEDLNGLRYPLLYSNKIDGIRAVTVGGRLLSRTLKAIPNKFVNDEFKKLGLPDGLDGELCVEGVGSFGDCSSAIMSRDGAPSVIYYIFDFCVGWAGGSMALPYSDRYRGLIAAQGEWLKKFGDSEGMPFMPLALKHQYAHSFEGAEIACRVALKMGNEGVVFRDPSAAYKNGRSTLKEQGMLKYKPFQDDEAEIVGTIELQHNTNEARDARGRRTSHKAGKVPGGVLGALVCRTKEGVEFEVGTGFTDAQRKQMWRIRAPLLGQWVKFKHLPYGAKEKPRHPVFLGIRNMEVDG